MFKNLLQKLRGNPIAEAKAEDRFDEVREERDDAAAGMVDGKGVMPTGTVADFDADQEAPPSEEDLV